MSGILNLFTLCICVCVCEGYTMSQTSETPINISGLLWKRGHHIPPPHRCHSVSVSVRVLTQRIRLPLEKKLLTFPLTTPKNFTHPIGELGWSRGVKTLSEERMGARVGVCSCISPTAAPGLHLIRPLFLSCPNRQALWVMNISQAAFQQQQVSVSVPVSSQWLWSAVLLHPKGVCVRVWQRESKCGRKVVRKSVCLAEGKVYIGGKRGGGSVCQRKP